MSSSKDLSTTNINYFVGIVLLTLTYLFIYGIVPGLISAIICKWFSTTLLWAIFSACIARSFTEKLYVSVMIGVLIILFGNEIPSLYIPYICYIAVFIYFIATSEKQIEFINIILYLMFIGVPAILSAITRCITLWIINFIC